MKDIMQKLAELEATAPKVTKKKMLNEDSTTPPMNVSNKPASLKDMFEMLSENVAPGQKPLPVLDPQKKQAGMGFVTSDNPAVQNLLKNLDPKDVQIMQAPGQPGQPQVGQQQTTQTTQPNQAGATGQPQQGQQVMREVDSPVKARYTVKPTKYSTKGKFMVRDLKDHSATGVYQTEEEALAAAEKLNKERESRLMRGRNDDRAPANEGKKVDRMVKHIEKSEKKSGKSKEEAQDIAWATANKRGMLDNKNKKKVKEGDIAPTHNIDTKGAGLGAGRSQTTLEGKKPDFLDLDKDGNKKESMKQAAADKSKKKVSETSTTKTPKHYGPFKSKQLAKSNAVDEIGGGKEGVNYSISKKDDGYYWTETVKKKVKESMNHRISAARLEGKSHGLRGHAHAGKRYEDLAEMKAYHEGYKDGMDELHEMGMYETAPAATVPGMASATMPTMEDDMEEGNAFTAALAKTPKGGKFTVGGKTYTDRTGYDSKVNEYAFESLDQQLNALLNESEEVTEGLSVSISKGQQNSPDSVTITAQDQEAEHLLAFVKNAGLGLFGDDTVDTHSSAMSVQPSHGSPDEVGAGGADVEVVDGHDGMMGLMQKLSGIQSAGGDDYEDEEGGEEQLYGNHDHTHEETCMECGGMMEAGHGCGSKMDEEESEDQMEFEVAEDNAPDSDEAETSADEDAEAKEDAALAGEKEEEMNESFASLLDRLTKLAEGSGDKPKHPEHDEKDDKDFDDAEEVNEAKEDTEEEDEKAEKAGKKVTKDIEYDDKKDKKEKIDEWANDVGKKGTDASFEQDIDFMTKVIAGGLNKPKSTGQTTVPVIAGQTERMSNPKETVTESVSDWVKLAGIK